MLRAIALLILASILAACGGGSGGGGSLPTEALSPAPARPQAAPIKVSRKVAPSYGVADCPRLLDPTAAAAALDLSDPDIRAVNEYVKNLDPAHAYGVFLRRPYDFVNWIVYMGGTVDLVSLPTASHENTHTDDEVLASCAPEDKYKALFMGAVLATNLKRGDTPNVIVVDAVIDPALKSFFRYGPYIARAAPGNDFTILLDELAAYTGAAQTELRMLQAGDYLSSGGDMQMGGSVTMMVYVQNYLKAVRLNDRAAWDLIRGDAATVAAMQAMWSRAEEILRQGFVYTQPGGQVRMRVERAYFDAAYSTDLLSELDAIGVKHALRADWSATYLR